MNEPMRTGGCACGQLTLTAHGEPDRVGVCHCMTCRKTTGSVLSLFAVFPKDRVIIEGRYKAWETNAGGKRCFCPDCGSRVFELCGAEIEIMGGAFDEPNAVRPTYEIWVIRREHWLPATDMPSYARGRKDP
jgi:hypothetical protein